MWKLHDTLKQTMGQRRNSKKIRKQLEMNENETEHSNIYDIQQRQCSEGNSQL